MLLEITKTDFERAVPAAREPKGKIFDVMQDAIMCKVEVIADSILGEPGIEAVEDGTDDVAERLRFEVKDSTNVKEKEIKAAGAAGVIRPSKTTCQVVIGPEVQFVYDEVKKLL